MFPVETAIGRVDGDGNCARVNPAMQRRRRTLLVLAAVLPWQFFANGLIDAVDIQFCCKGTLHGVDDGKFRITLLGVFQQALSLIEKSNIFDRDHSLVGERFDQLDLFLSKRLHLCAADGNTADRFSITEQWDRQRGAVSPATLQGDAHRVFGFSQL